MYLHSVRVIDMQYKLHPFLFSSPLLSLLSHIMCGITVYGIRTQRQFFEALCATEELSRLLFSQASTPEVLDYAIQYLQVGYLHCVFFYSGIGT